MRKTREHSKHWIPWSTASHLERNTFQSITRGLHWCVYESESSLTKASQAGQPCCGQLCTFSSILTHKRKGFKTQGAVFLVHAAHLWFLGVTVQCVVLNPTWPWWLHPLQRPMLHGQGLQQGCLSRRIWQLGGARLPTTLRGLAKASWHRGSLGCIILQRPAGSSLPHVVL